MRFENWLVNLETDFGPSNTSKWQGGSCGFFFHTPSLLLYPKETTHIEETTPQPCADNSCLQVSKHAPRLVQRKRCFFFLIGSYLLLQKKKNSNSFLLKRDTFHLSARSFHSQLCGHSLFIFFVHRK